MNNASQCAAAIFCAVALIAVPVAFAGKPVPRATVKLTTLVHGLGTANQALLPSSHDLSRPIPF